VLALAIVFASLWASTANYIKHDWDVKQKMLGICSAGSTGWRPRLVTALPR